MRPVLKFNIRNQKISRVDNFLPVRYSRNYLYAEFDFKTEDWTLVAKTAIFTSQNHLIHVVLGATDTCLVPPEVLTDTWFTVSVFGGDLITVTTEKIKLYESGYRPDGVTEPTPDVYTQLLNMVSSKADGLSYSDNILSLLSGDKTIATVTITSASDEGDSTAREIELRNNGTYIQWKYTDETLWRDLVSLEDISGKDAYKYAQEAGYTKSEEQFAIDLAKEPGATEEQAKQIEQNKTDIENLQQDMGNNVTYGEEIILINETVEIPIETPVTKFEYDLPEIAKELNHFHVYIKMDVATNEHIAKRTQLWLFGKQMIYWNIGDTTPLAVWNTNIFIDFTRKLVDFILPNNYAQDLNRFPLYRYCRYSNLSYIDRNINKFTFELLSEYSGTVTIEVHGYK